MVFFTCDACGQSVKKNQVENHCFQCRGCRSLSCMDCNVVFWGDDYKNHVKCVTEDERYGGKDYQPKASSNKGEIKQEKWIEHIQSTISSKKIPGPLSGLLNQIITYSNIPRKQSKFENFLKNSLKIRNPNLISQAWEIFAQSTKNESESSKVTVNGTKAVNGTNGVNHNTSTKRSADSPSVQTAKKPCLDDSSNSKEVVSKNNFNWCEAAEKVLLDFPSGLSEKKLRKEVIAQYKAAVATCSLSNSELKKIFRNNVLQSPSFCLNVAN
ncbi:hypothetical protein JTE90_014769 [Oedothorax gibbosus]|uniref:Cell growth-regulating nucleolar protein n=1 Tax=Oedothorax gibbosus TaxID=931172 RepID=A0AAV6UQD9_9ARAC|nr:hypothetical protein JTE90_014769 [Oedothorax gibbosus]